MTTEFEIVPIQALRIRYKGRDGTRRYYTATTRAALRKRLGWWVIFDKHTEQAWQGSLPDGTECECDNYGGGPEWDGCPIHDRHEGYFRRLHTRIIRQIAAGIMFPDSGLADD